MAPAAALVPRSSQMLSIGAISMVFATVLSGFWGMNLPSGLEGVPHAFWMVAGTSTAACVVVLAALTRGVTRFHRVQREMFASSAGLQKALLQVDHPRHTIPTVA